MEEATMEQMMCKKHGAIAERRRRALDHGQDKDRRECLNCKVLALRASLQAIPAPRQAS